MPYPSLDAQDRPRLPVTVTSLTQMRAHQEPIAMLTAYDASFAALADRSGVDVILIGDSLGMVCQGHKSTLAVQLADVAYHTQSVVRGLEGQGGSAMVLADMPFASYHASVGQAIRSASTLMQAGAHMVKLEGGGWVVDTVYQLVQRGIPVCAHLGLMPQTVHALGGYRLQGKAPQDAERMLNEAIALEQAGASLLVLEMVPASLAARITESLIRCHSIGIGAGCATAGQVLVLHDMLGIRIGKTPRFVKDFMAQTGSIEAAMKAYVREVKDRSFPVDAIHGF
ncbi:MAG: 3-methyl-2-oxobutanoate hydroxymethyltransferase [Betaproteobacteria bacterium]|nr:3-methyl-2-oxobutanoate hydroxymethyltransferase [Betaproteobacteria bacterium]